jgi:hypothetical protein
MVKKELINSFAGCKRESVKVPLRLIVVHSVWKVFLVQFEMGDQLAQCFEGRAFQIHMRDSTDEA